MLNEKQMYSIGEMIVNQKESIAREVEELVNRNQNLGKIEHEELIQIRAEFVGLIGESLTKDNLDDVLEKVYEWGKNLGDYATESSVPLHEALWVIPHYRQFIFKFISKEFENENLTFDDNNLISERINPTIDQIIYAFTQSFVKYHEKVFNEAKEELIELSVPIVTLTEDVAILPLVGTLDTYRAQQLLEQTLKMGSKLGLKYLIIDLTGVHMIDTAVAKSLFQLHDALKLMGITAIIAGLRPELAQTMVTLGISLNEMKVVQSLPNALPLTGLSIDLDN
ncbi:STAS domain-containing protein [Alteribacter natronophilus]|uniref:STAS domain-containing protein n=1 Tax=Alteribacter natronophilus TaxID=2583810 RepID=UPI00110EFCE6|nr:STAS domain-containing protein [Alteribacter natronophilus]TMW72275.1 STAS domain-containing protein [Alteribacter natronophilus]